jgi:hypothetical protein
MRIALYYFAKKNKTRGAALRPRARPPPRLLSGFALSTAGFSPTTNRAGGASIFG